MKPREGEKEYYQYEGAMGRGPVAHPLDTAFAAVQASESHRFPKKLRNSPPMRRTEWSAWQLTASLGGIPAHEYYGTRIDPMVERALTTYAPLLPQNTCLQVADAPCGYGRLALKVLQRHLAQPVDYLGIDSNMLQIHFASGVLKATHDGDHRRVTLGVQDFDRFLARPDVKGKFHLFISCGGMVSLHVAKNGAAARKNIAGIFKATAPGGLVVLTGASPALVTQKDLKRAGFDVLQSQDPETKGPIFVCRKPGASDHQRLKVWGSAGGGGALESSAAAYRPS